MSDGVFMALKGSGATPWRVHTSLAAVGLASVSALLLGACGSSSKSKRSGSTTTPERPFSVALQNFEVQGNTATYAVSTTLHGRSDATPPSKEAVRYFCSVNGQPFERCRESGPIPSGRLQIGLNTFQVQARVGDRESSTPLYHEFTVGIGAPQ